MSNAWINGADMQVVRSGFATCMIGQKIYCVGGSSSSAITSAEVYDTANNTWSTIASLPNITSHHSCVSVGNKIYAIGDTMQVFDGSKWITHELPDHAKRKYFTCLPYENKLYCIGGRPGSKLISIFDIASNSWSTIPNNNSITDTCGVLYEDKFIIISNNVWIYDPKNDSWSKGARIPHYVYYMTCALLGDRVYVAMEIEKNTKIQFYEIETDKWYLGQSVTNSRSAHCTEAVNGKLYVMGGMVDRGTSGTLEIYDPQLDTFVEHRPQLEFIYVDDESKAKIRKSESDSIAYGETYTVVPPQIPGYSFVRGRYEGNDLGPNDLVIEGLRHNVAINLYYRKRTDAVIITERFVGADNVSLLPDSVTELDLGQDYAKTAPFIEGQKRVGYRLDDGEIQPYLTASIPNIQAGHTVTFVYEPGEENPRLTYPIHVEFRSEEGIILKSAAELEALEGEAFVTIAPTIRSYRCTGYQIDDGATQAGSTATIPDVSAPHTIVFFYKKEGSTDPGGNTCSCGCAQVRININGCQRNSLVKDICKLIGDGAYSCDCQ